MKIIDHKRWYRPMEMAADGLIQTRRSDNGTVGGNYKLILKLIKTKQLKAYNYGLTATPYYLVCEDEIERYHKSIVGAA